jgi:hypothetical protein
VVGTKLGTVKSATLLVEQKAQAVRFEHTKHYRVMPRLAESSESEISSL